MQIVGEKHFVLLPPIAVAMVGERELRGGRYVRNGSKGLGVRMDGEEDEGGKVPFATWDPDGDGVEGKYVGLVKPMRVTLEAGDMLYLPAMW